MAYEIIPEDNWVGNVSSSTLNNQRLFVPSNQDSMSTVPNQLPTKSSPLLGNWRFSSGKGHLKHGKTWMHQTMKHGF